MTDATVSAARATSSASTPTTDIRSARTWRILRAFVVLTALMLKCVTPAAADFPFSFTVPDDRSTTPVFESWTFWPFGETRREEHSSVRGAHPLWARWANESEGERGLDVLWPFYTHRERDRTFTATNRVSTTVFPLWYSTRAERDGVPFHHKYLIPFYWSGGKQGAGKYTIVFPFYWHANDAEMVVPFFPPRKQTFAALWPFAGVFYDWFGRDRIRFVLWPIFVDSTRGQGADKFTAHHFIWPIFTVFSGEKVSGFRMWPLFSTVKREGEFSRTTFLWPLGQIRKGRISDANAGQEDTKFFFPFFARIRRPTWDFDLIFPFKGELRTAGRRVTGYALAFYNHDDDMRTGIRNHRLAWIFIRWTSRIPVKAEFQPEDGKNVERAPEGGGFFPFYLNQRNEKKIRQAIIWPFYQRRWNAYDDSDFDRRFLFPFHASLTKTFKDGSVWKRSFTWPIKRTWSERDGRYYSSAPHLFWYSKAEPIDRNWAPVWTLWEKEGNVRTGDERVRVAKGAYMRTRTWYGLETTRRNLLFYRSVKETGPNRPTTKRTVWFWGLMVRETVGETTQTRWFSK